MLVVKPLKKRLIDVERSFHHRPTRNDEFDPLSVSFLARETLTNLKYLPGCDSRQLVNSQISK